MKGFSQINLQDFMKKNNTWNFWHLVDELFVQSAQQTSVLYCKLTNFKDTHTIYVICIWNGVFRSFFSWTFMYVCVFCRSKTRIKCQWIVVRWRSQIGCQLPHNGLKLIVKKHSYFFMAVHFNEIFHKTRPKILRF